MNPLFNPVASKIHRKCLRANITEPEKHVWSKLRGKQMMGYKFRRQFGIGKFIVDFYSSELKLAIEIDGDSHIGELAAQYDKQREEFLSRQGIRCLRFTSQEVMRNLDGVLQTVFLYIKKERIYPL